MTADEGRARVSARASFARMADRDVHSFAGFLTSWLADNLTMQQLADLVEQLDAAFPERWVDSGSGVGFEVRDSGAVIELPDDDTQHDGTGER
jgi:hypothetical protein